MLIRRLTLQPCLPRPAKEPPAGPGWIHEIKHDGFRILARREGGRVRLFTRHGTDFTARYPKIAAASRACVRSCALDGEAIVVNTEGLSVFDLIRYRHHDHAAVLCAFDLTELDGRDLRWQPVERRKAMLADLLRDTRDGIAFNQHTTATARPFSSTPARSAAKASCRSASARPIAPAGSTTGSRSRTRPRRP